MWTSFGLDNIAVPSPLKPKPSYNTVDLFFVQSNFCGVTVAQVPSETSIRSWLCNVRARQRYHDSALKSDRRVLVLAGIRRSPR